MPTYEMEVNGKTYEIDAPKPPTSDEALGYVAKIGGTAPSETWATRHPLAADITRSTLNALPAAGAIGGGLLATPETAGAGTAVGMGLGAAAGRGARDLIAEQLGLQAPS